MFHSITMWNLAMSPNYATSVDKIYPYSEIPYVGNYKLVKIPTYADCVEHVDYWGEGRIKTFEGISGFPDCYNVNHQYQLVSNGPDTDRKIPNRIPVISYTNCDTSSYIKDNSVKIVTLMGAPINKSCAKDIARMVNGYIGKVVVYGFSEDSADIRNLNEELRKKELYYCHGYDLPEKLKGLTIFATDEYKAYINVTELCEQLYKNVTISAYDNAVNITKTLQSANFSDKITSTVNKLLKEGNKNIMGYAYKLWNSDAEDIVTKNFPISFKLILNEDNVKIINKKNMFALKLDENTDVNNEKLAFGDSKDKSSDKVLWKLLPVWDKDNIYFKIMNIKHGMFLKLEPKETSGDKTAKGNSIAADNGSQWSVEPLKVDDDLLFYITNREFKQGLKLYDTPDSSGDCQLLGHSGSVYGHPEIYGWFIAPQ